MTMESIAIDSVVLSVMTRGGITRCRARQVARRAVLTSTFPKKPTALKASRGRTGLSDQLPISGCLPGSTLNLWSDEGRGLVRLLSESSSIMIGLPTVPPREEGAELCNCCQSQPMLSWCDSP